MDECLVTVVNNGGLSLSVYGNTELCHNCLNIPLSNTVLASKEQRNFSIETTFPFHFEFRDAAGAVSLINFTYFFEEYGWYQVNIDEDKNHTLSVSMTVISSPHNAFMPILYAFIIYLGMAVLYILFNRFLRKPLTSYFYPQPTSFNTPLINPNNINSERVDKKGRMMFMCV